MARDGAFPGSDYVKVIYPATKSPLGTVALVFIVDSILLLFPLGTSLALNAVLSITVIGELDGRERRVSAVLLIAEVMDEWVCVCVPSHALRWGGPRRRESPVLRARLLLDSRSGGGFDAKA